MASQELGWTEATSKSNAKKNKMKEIQQAIKQQHADYLHNRDFGLEDELEELEYVAETPEHLAEALGFRAVTAETAEHPAEALEHLVETPEHPAEDLEQLVGAQRGNASVAGASGMHDSIKVLPAYKAWLRRGAEFDLDPRYHKRELALVKFDIIEKDRIVLDEQDIIPVPRGWGACLLGRFTGRFPGKEAIQGLMRRWPCKSRVTYHSKGWLVFQFGSDNDRETVRQKGPFEIFGIPLVLQPMPEDFDPTMEPEVNIPLWIRLVDLPLKLWNLTAISKIASCFGTPLSTDFNTLRRESLDGPRVQVIINTAIRPKTSITVQLPTGPYEQNIEYEFFPSFCNSCKMYGHFADECRGRKAVYEQNVPYGAGPRAKSKDRARSKSRPHEQYNARASNNEWPRLRGNQGGKITKGVLGARPAPTVRSRSRTRQEWVATGGVFDKPINVTCPRPRKESGLSDPRGLPRYMQGDPMQQGGNAGDETIPTSPNRFEALVTEDGAAPEVAKQSVLPEDRSTEQTERIKDLLNTTIAPILAGLNGMPSTHRTNGRDRSRDPRPPRANLSDVMHEHARPEPGNVIRSAEATEHARPAPGAEACSAEPSQQARPDPCADSTSTAMAQRARPAPIADVAPASVAPEYLASTAAFAPVSGHVEPIKGHGGAS